MPPSSGWLCHDGRPELMPLSCDPSPGVRRPPPHPSWPLHAPSQSPPPQRATSQSQSHAASHPSSKTQQACDAGALSAPHDARPPRLPAATRHAAGRYPPAPIVAPCWPHARRSRPQAPQSAARRHSPPRPRRGTPPPPSPPDSAARVRPTRRPQPPSVRPPFGGSSSMPRAGSPLAFRPRVVASSRARPSARAASSPRPSLAAPPAMLPDPHGRIAPPFAPSTGSTPICRAAR